MDAHIAAFGIGTSHAYDLFLIGDSTHTWADLILPDGGRVPFVRTSGGTGYASAVMEHATAPGPFFKATLQWNNARAAWDLTRRDGVRYEFGTASATGVRLIAIVDRSGNRLRIERSGAHVSRLVSPHGRTLDFTRDGSDRVTSVTDHIGRQITYTYDGSGRLWKVTDPLSGVTEFTYDTAHRMLTITDARGITFLTNAYDGNGRVIEQTQADLTEYGLGATGCDRVRPGALGAAGCGWVRQHRVNRHCRSVSRDFPCVSDLSNAVPDDRACCQDSGERCT